MFSDIEREVKECELPLALGVFVAHSPILYNLSIEQLQWMQKNGKEAVRLFVTAMNSHQSVSKPTRSWREKDGVIYFSVTSDGTTGEDMINRYKRKYFRVGDYAKQVLRSRDFKPTSGVTTEVAVLKGMLFEDNNRIMKKICAEADKRKLSKPNAELAYLIRMKFKDEEIEEMGLSCIIAMHESINDSNGNPHLLYADRRDGGDWLGACLDNPDRRWRRDIGFAFAVSQVSSQP